MHNHTVSIGLWAQILTRDEVPIFLSPITIILQFHFVVIIATRMSGKQQDKPVSQPVIPPPAAETMTLPEKLFQTELENNRYKKELEEKDKQINKYEADIGRLNKKVQELMEHLQLKDAEVLAVHWFTILVLIY